MGGAGDAAASSAAAVEEVPVGNGADMQVNHENDWLVWQLVDSCLPTGGFAHSYGLESALQLGLYDLKAPSEIRRLKGLELFIRHTLRQQASLLLPVVRQSYHLEAIEQWQEVDSLCHAVSTNAAGRRASIAQGQALLRLAIESFPLVSEDNRQTFITLRRQIRRGDPIPGCHGHMASLWGWICRSLGISSHTADKMFLYMVLRDTISAANRLAIVGPRMAVSTQMRLYPVVEEALAKANSQSLGAIAQNNPILDIVQGAHDQLYSRLFNS